jgi:hypothetical protein
MSIVARFCFMVTPLKLEYDIHMQYMYLHISDRHTKRTSSLAVAICLFRLSGMQV